jgi:hypothetical protein
MIFRKLYISFLEFILLVLSLSACKQATTPSMYQPVSAPSRTLSAIEIMSIEGITAIRYILYDSTVYIGSRSDSTFIPIAEFLIDSKHIKETDYNGDKRITVYDLRNNIAWNYYSGQLTYLQLPNWPTPFEEGIQNCLGSWLQGPSRFLHTEYIDNKLCNVFSDSLGNQECVWIDHCLPIQEWIFARTLTSSRIITVRKRIIGINISFPDSLFEPPT